MGILISILIIILCFLRCMYLEEKTGTGEFLSEGVWWFFTGDDSGIKKEKERLRNK